MSYVNYFVYIYFIIKNKQTMDRTVNIISTWIGALIAVVLMGIIMAWPTQLLWNGCLVPAVSGISIIGFWQALGINVLFSLLFKSTNKVKTESK